jgi:hypothetical protein
VADGKFLRAKLTLCVFSIPNLKYRVSRLELELGPQLDHSGRDIVLRTGSENAGRGLLEIENLPKALGGYSHIRKPKYDSNTQMSFDALGDQIT